MSRLDDAYLDYWKDAAAAALEDVGVALTPEQLSVVAKSLQQSADMRSEAFGEHCIPNPAIAERREAETRHKREVTDLEKRSDLLRRSLASQLGCRPEQIYTNGENIYVDRR